MKFSEVFGQERIKEKFSSAIGTKKFSHAYILNGETGMGKRNLAEAFAAALLCENPQPDGHGGVDSCGECRTCRRIDHHNHPDVIYVEPNDERKLVTVDDVRERLIGDISMRPYESDYKVYIVTAAQRLGGEAQNAILKTIEEPPDYAVVLLLADNIEGLLPTIRSRCVTLNLTPVDDGRLLARLGDEHSLTAEQAETIAAYSQGNIGKARRMASDEEFMRLSDELRELEKEIGRYDDAAILAQAQHFSEEYKDKERELLDLLEVWYRDVLLYKETGEASRLMLGTQGYQVRQQAKAESYRAIGSICDAIDEAKRRVTYKTNTRLVYEQLFFGIREYIL